MAGGGVADLKEKSGGGGDKPGAGGRQQGVKWAAVTEVADLRGGSGLLRVFCCEIIDDVVCAETCKADGQVDVRREMGKGVSMVGKNRQSVVRSTRRFV